MAGRHVKEPDEQPTAPADAGGAPETPGDDGVGARRSAAEAARLQDQDEAQRAAESGQD